VSTWFSTPSEASPTYKKHQPREPPTTARALWRWGFICPPLWIVGMFMCVSPGSDDEDEDKHEGQGGNRKQYQGWGSGSRSRSQSQPHYRLSRLSQSPLGQSSTGSGSGSGLAAASGSVPGWTSTASTVRDKLAAPSPAHLELGPKNF
jgi:hypothetical protein